MTTEAARAYGPSALGGSTRRFIELTVTLARTEFKLRYFGSVLGYLWQLMRPLLFFGVIYVFFTVVLDVGKSIPNYGVYLLTGIVLWTFFAETTGNSVTCLVAREPLLRKVRFPRLAVPLSVSMTAVFNLAMNSIAVIVFALASGIQPRLSWLEMFPIVLGFIILATGIGMLLSALYVRFRDMAPIWDVVSQMLFYATPIMYIAGKYGGLEHKAMLNPLAMLVTQMGYAFVHPGLTYIAKYPSAVNPSYTVDHVEISTVCPAHKLTGCIPTYPMKSALVACGGPLHLAIAIGLIPAIFALGWWFFSREAPRVAENL